MERLNLSTYAKEIKADYDKVVSGELSYAVFTTLKDSALKPTATSSGDINEFVTEFEEGSVQFGIISISPFGSDVKKLLLLGWCPDSAPLKSKISFASNVAEVGKTLHYHVQVTARDSDDLDVDDLLKTVSNASGARYSIQSLATPKTTTGGSFKPKPKPASSQPVSSPASTSFTPSVKPSTFVKPSKPEPVSSKQDEDDWDGEEEIKERDWNEEPLNTLPSAYKKTTVDIDALRKGKSDTISSEPTVKPVKSASSPKESAPESFKDKIGAYVSLNTTGSGDGRLTSLPKIKTANSVASKYKEAVVQPEFGTKAPVFGALPKKDDSHLVGGLSRNFGADHGKTPAQLWAEKKGKFTDVAKDDKPVNSSSVEPEEKEEEVHVGDVKSKFESLNVEEEEEEEEVKHKPVSSFPPPPKRTIAPTPATISRFKEESEPEEEEPEWNDDEDDEEEEPKEAAAAAAAPPPLAPRPVPATPAAVSAAVSAPEPKSAPAPEPELIKKPTAETTEIKAIAEYDYEKDEDNEIAFTEGELIINIKIVDEDWWFGVNSSGESGLFPASYVTLKEENGTATAPAEEEEEEKKSSGPSAVAEYDYDATEDNELTFKEGDLITDIEMVDEDWWLGTLQGDRKLFPANFVTLQD
ncbi:hypothetical protein CANARDRAFT_5734 [[Candida] arabinofermentans NRRL YB-2248]|uniref:Actin-binding protein n=1 Tax=[Candida] arabinofermentans NRRL YB-2248 TaxID=983967 RepID=A0A1E4T5Z3_9ASCO|nr:hypothetical protein CANARDRAFT_5734 [[Candida] arabinofermentans NRRL YB-2248]